MKKIKYILLLSLFLSCVSSIDCPKTPKGPNGIDKKGDKCIN